MSHFCLILRGSHQGPAAPRPCILLQPTLPALQQEGKTKYISGLGSVGSLSLISSSSFLIFFTFQGGKCGLYTLLRKVWNFASAPLVTCSVNLGTIAHLNSLVLSWFQLIVSYGEWVKEDWQLLFLPIFFHLSFTDSSGSPDLCGRAVQDAEGGKINKCTKVCSKSAFHRESSAFPNVPSSMGLMSEDPKVVFRTRLCLPQGMLRPPPTSHQGTLWMANKSFVHKHQLGSGQRQHPNAHCSQVMLCKYSYHENQQTVGNWQGKESSLPRVLQGKHKTKWQSMKRDKAGNTRGSAQRDRFSLLRRPQAEPKTGLGSQISERSREAQLQSPYTCLVSRILLPFNVISCSVKREQCYMVGREAVNYKSLSSCHQCGMPLVI